MTEGVGWGRRGGVGGESEARWSVDVSTFVFLGVGIYIQKGALYYLIGFIYYYYIDMPPNSRKSWLSKVSVLA